MNPKAFMQALAVIVFGTMFGVLFIIMGVRRVMAGLRGPNTIESAFWGVVGIALGLLWFLGVAWFFQPHDHPHSIAERPFDQNSRS